MTTDVGPESVSRERFVDLRAYEGLTVALIFNVRGDLPSRTALVWEAPTLVQR